MAKEQIKLVFNSDYSPRKKGEIAVFKGRDEMRTAEWYIANGIASECDCAKDAITGKGCTGCDEAAAIAKGNAPDTGQNTGVSIDGVVTDQVIGTVNEPKTTASEGDDDDDDEKLKAPESIEMINSMLTVEEVRDALEGETRKTVIAAAEKRIEALEAEK